MTTSNWQPIDGYEVLYCGSRAWWLLVRGGDYYSQEPSWRTMATFTDRDEAFRVRDQMRKTLDAPTQ